MDGNQRIAHTTLSLSLSLTLKSQYSYSFETRREGVSLFITHTDFSVALVILGRWLHSLSLSPLYLLRVCFSENVFARLESHTAVVPVFTFCGLLLPLSHSPLLLPSVCSSDVDRPASYQLVCPIERR